MANEKRLIDANEFWNRLSHVVYDFFADPEQAGDYAMEGYFKQTIAIVLSQTKTVDAVEVVHGRWRRFINGDGEYKYLCNVCEKIVTYEMGGSNYCPNCGAKMDGGNEDV